MYTLTQWTVDDYHRMIEAGILNGRSVELLSGDIIEMSPESPTHRFVNNRGVKYLRSVLGKQAEVLEAHPITLADSEPEPDIAIVRYPDSLYLHRHPYPADVYWLIEIADSTLKKDLGLKKNLYARANIPEYWVIDLKGKNLTVFQNPLAENYQLTQTYQEGLIYPLAFPAIAIDVKNLLEF
jgi:Uma2 family endonuclease